MERIKNLTGAKIRHRKMSVKLRQKIETSLLSTTYFFAFVSGLGWFIFANSVPLMKHERVAEFEKLKQFLLKNEILFEFFDNVDGVVLD